MDDRADLIDDYPGGIQGEGREAGHVEAILNCGPPFSVHGGGVIPVKAIRGKQIIGRRQMPVFIAVNEREVFGMVILVPDEEIKDHKPEQFSGFTDIAGEQKSRLHQGDIIE